MREMAIRHAIDQLRTRLGPYLPQDEPGTATASKGRLSGNRLVGVKCVRLAGLFERRGGPRPGGICLRTRSTLG